VTRRTIVDPAVYRHAVARARREAAAWAAYHLAYEAAKDAREASKQGTPYDYPCPLCNAPPGQVCLTPDGTPHPNHRRPIAHAIRETLPYPCPRCGAAPGWPCDIPPTKRQHFPHHFARANPSWPDETDQYL
jgi:hypothetical protein